MKTKVSWCIAGFMFPSVTPWHCRHIITFAISSAFHCGYGCSWDPTLLFPKSSYKFRIRLMKPCKNAFRWTSLFFSFPSFGGSAWMIAIAVRLVAYCPPCYCCSRQPSRTIPRTCCAAPVQEWPAVLPTTFRLRVINRLSTNVAHLRQATLLKKANEGPECLL